MDISAQVVLRVKGPITVATLAANQPPEDAIGAARRFFQGVGFELGPFVGISFSISGPSSLFKRVFGIRPDALKAFELPLKALPREVIGVIDAVTFTPPPDFGPSGTGP